MMRPVTCCVLLAAPCLAQDFETAVVEAGYLVVKEVEEHLPRLTPGSPPLLALGRRERGARPLLLMDVISATLVRRGGSSPQVRLAGGRLHVACKGLARKQIEAAVADTLDMFAPAVQLRIELFGAVPAPGAVVAVGKQPASLPKKPIVLRTVWCRVGRCRTLLWTAQDGGRRLRLRLQPNPLSNEPARMAVGVEFQYQEGLQGPEPKWSAGVASGVVPKGGRLVLTLPGATLAISGTVRRRPEQGRDILGVPWSIVMASFLRASVRFDAERSGLWAFEALRPVGSQDVARGVIQDLVGRARWDRMICDTRPDRLLFGSEDAKLMKQELPKVRTLVKRLEQPWAVTATIDGAVSTGDGRGIAVVRLPTLPGRFACFSHASTIGKSTKGALVVLHWSPSEIDGIEAVDDKIYRGARFSGTYWGFGARWSGIGSADDAPIQFRKRIGRMERKSHLLVGDGLRLSIER